ncbi:MAG TPA: hypothetical protein ENJ56_08635, partial [Anaerolineae bacterium]|nr:hypothetical protein [Anaerolineae bacterium]
MLGLNKASIAAADKEISVLSAETIGLAPIITPQDPRRQLDPRRPALVQILPAVTAPDSVISQQITVYNDEAYTRQVTLTQQLPAAFDVTTLPNNVSWDNVTRQWTWTGQIAGGNLDYKINTSDA